MKKDEILDELSKVAVETNTLDKSMSEDLDKLAKHLATALSDDELDSFNDKEASVDKEAKLINEGDIVICVDNFQPLMKGRKYLVSDASIPGYLCIKELDCNGGGDVGVFAINRFSLDWNAQ